MNLGQKRAPAPKPQAVKKKPKGIQKTPGAKMEGFDKAAFVRKRGPLCQCGECGERGEDAHHALFNRNKKFPQLDAEENLILVNHFEHVSLRKFSTLEWRQRFWIILCGIHGKEHMLRWLVSLPPKLHSRVDFLDPADKLLFNAAVLVATG